MNFDKMTIKEIKEYINELDKVNDSILINLQKDERIGVKKIADSIIKKRKAKQKKINKWHDQNQEIYKLIEDGYRLITGIDEAGRGPLAGPVVSSAVILDIENPILGLTDSKKLSEAAREDLFDIIINRAVSVGIGIVSNTIIDRVNIYQATFIAMKRAIEDLKVDPEFILVDGNQEIPEINIPQKAIISGDLKVNSISAASIIAKVTRDRIMDELHKDYPQYNFLSNKGYGTQEHIEAVKEIGPCPYHRFSYKIIKNNRKMDTGV